jgi:protein-L-isoaspartate(D-aspartate) O-methyltransferase
VTIARTNRGAGFPAQGPYNCIHVGAAAPVLPQQLLDQLAKPGRLFIPVGTVNQRLLQIDKDEDGNITHKDLFGVIVRFLIFSIPQN